MNKLSTIKEYKRCEKHFNWSIFKRKHIIEVESDLDNKEHLNQKEVNKNV